MSIFNREFQIDDLINISSAGLVVADFNKIRESLINLNKTIYGNDIDMSGESPDVQYITSIALIINNILQLTQFAYKNMDPATAEGKYLDILCKLSNIKRHSRTRSVANLFVKNVTNTTQSPKQINFIDRAGNEWQWDNSKIYGFADQYEKTWQPGQINVLDNVYCLSYGNINAYGNKNINIDEWDFNDIENNGDIYQTIDYGTFQVCQINDATPGYDQESDNDLRIRYAMSAGAQSVSVLSGLKSALLDIACIKDCLIYNGIATDNISTNYKTMSDTTQVNLHDIYICLRYIEGVDVSSTTIGNLIYNKLTPGIRTCGKATESLKYGKIIDYTINKSNTLKYHIYWKKCTPIALNDYNIKINIRLLPDIYDYPNMENRETNNLAQTLVEKNISNAIINYLNNITLNTPLMLTQLNSAIQAADITKNGLPTFVVLESTSNSEDLNLSYFNVKNNNIHFIYSNTDNKLLTIAITEE